MGKCLDDLRANYSRGLSDAEIEEIFKDAQRLWKGVQASRQASNQNALAQQLAKQQAEREQIAAVIKKRNTYLQLERKVAILESTLGNWQGREGEGLSAMLVGGQKLRQGSRMSVDALRTGIKGQYVGGFLNDLDELGATHYAIFKKGAMDREIAEAMWTIDNPNAPAFSGLFGARDKGDNVFRIWQESAETKGTQLIFSDLSTPKGKAEPKKEEAKENTEGTETEAAATEEETAMEASVYEDIRKKLIAKGIPPQEIAFIHDANTETQKAELFAKVRNGQVRVLLGSTQKMGAGTNVQTKLVASHDLDCPWRPADLEQRAGRIVRRGNENDHVKIYRYVTKGTFDAYTWGLVESKQKFIGQIMTSKSPARSIEDVDATALSYAEVKMLATGDVRIKEKMDLDIQVTKLKMLKSNHQAQQYEMQDKVRGYYPNKIKETQLYIDCLNADLPVLEAHPVKEDAFSMTVMGNVYTERKEAGKAIVAACRLMDDPGKEIELGEYRGFPMKLMFDGAKFKVTMKQHLTHTAELSDDVVGNITRINNALEKIPQSLANHKENMARLHKELESAKEEAERPFAQEAELQEKSARLAELNTVLDNEEKGRGTEPARETEEDAERGNEKPSILKTLKEYERPAPANFGAERGQEREAI